MNSARRVVGLGILFLGGLGALGCAHYHQPPGVFQPPLAPEVRNKRHKSGGDQGSDQQLSHISILRTSWHGSSPALRRNRPATREMACRSAAFWQAGRSRNSRSVRLSA
jgi:hypothetical protein